MFFFSSNSISLNRKKPDNWIEFFLPKRITKKYTMPEIYNLIVIECSVNFTLMKWCTLSSHSCSCEREKTECASLKQWPTVKKNKRIINNVWESKKICMSLQSRFTFLREGSYSSSFHHKFIGLTSMCIFDLF